jgi:cytochrome c oxidase subunit 4
MEYRKDKTMADKIRRVQLPEMRKQLWVYILSISLTLLAFWAVTSRFIEHPISITLFLLMLAILQIMFQLFYFMHLKERSHFFAIMIMFFAISVTIFLVAGINLWLWW